MGQETDIGWVRNSDGSKGATLNWWIGCTEVSRACDNCYARVLAKRFGWAAWGPGEPRYMRLQAGAKQAFRLERRARRLGIRIRVFSNSLSDIFDAEVPDEARDFAMAVVALTPHLDHLWLTKRPQVAAKYFASIDNGNGERIEGLRDALVEGMAQKLYHERTGEDPSMWLAVHLPLPNLWLGTTAENQKMWDLRVPQLEEIPAALHFVSVEPIVERINAFLFDRPKVRWVLCGGESGAGAAESDLAHHRNLRDQCLAAGVAFFEKQLGARPVESGRSFRQPRGAGADPTYWPEDLRVQQMPEVAA